MVLCYDLMTYGLDVMLMLCGFNYYSFVAFSKPSVVMCSLQYFLFRAALDSGCFQTAFSTLEMFFVIVLSQSLVF